MRVHVENLEILGWTQSLAYYRRSCFGETSSNQDIYKYESRIPINIERRMTYSMTETV